MKKIALMISVLGVLLSVQSVQAAESIMAMHEQNKGIAKLERAKDEELLAHLIMGEAGADYCEDAMLYGVGNVALNRVKSNKFPNSLEDVIFQRGQYACTWDGNFNIEPNDRCYRIARELLDGKRTLPDNVVFQAEFEQGSGTYDAISFLGGRYMYFCYE